MIKKLISFLILSAFLAGQCFATVDWVQMSYFQNSGGLNNAFSPIAIEDNEASDLQNVIFTVSGSFKKRSGFEAVNEDNVGDTCGIKYIKFSDGDQYLVGIFDNDKVYSMDYGVSGPDGTWHDITGAISFNASANNLSTFAIGQDTLVIDDGIASTAPFKWTGTGDCAALGGSPPKATIVAFHKNMAFAAGNEDNPSTLYFSDIGDIENWTTGLSGNIGVETNDGSIIRAIVPGFDALYIFKDYSIFRLTGSDKDSFQLQKMVNGVGVTSPQAISTIGNQFFFITGQGSVYLYDGAIGLKKLSSKVAGTLKTDISFSRYAYAVSTTYDDDYYVAVSTTGSNTNDLVLMFDSFSLSWTKFVGLNINAMTVGNDGTGRDKIFFGDYSGATLKYPQGDDDNGAAIDAYYITKQFNYPELGPTKDLKLLKVYFAEEATSYNLEVTVMKDFEITGTTTSIDLSTGTGSVFGTAVYGTDVYGGDSIISQRIESNLEGSFYKIKFQNNATDNPFEVFGFQTYIEKEDRQ